MNILFNRNKTLKPLKAQKDGKKSQLSQFAQHTLATLGSGSMLQAVKLPKGEDLNEWLAVNTTDFFNELSMLYGTIADYCSKASCPVMSAGECRYLWADAKTPKPVEVSAPEYVDFLMAWVESQLNDEKIFPVKFDSVYPKDFRKVVATIYKRFFRIYGHIYHAHFKQIQALGADAHLNTCFKHFIYFILEFKLVESKELTPLQELIDNMLGADKQKLYAAAQATPSSAGAASSAAAASSPAGSPVGSDENEGEVVRNK